jgi:ABC-type sugar transport system, periplasmic component
MKKKMKMMVSVAVIAALVLTGCGGTSTQAPAESTEAPAATTEEATTEEATETPAGEPVEISLMLQLPPEIVLENNPVIEAIEEKLNVKLNIEAPPLNSYEDRVKMAMATGEMPDLLHYGADIFATQWAEEGLLLEVTDKLKEYPGLASNISQEQLGDTEFFGDGKIYGVPRPNSADKWGYLINQKWLDKVGLEAPKTIDEFIEVCRAFTNDDPDGNGNDDTFGAGLHAQQSSLDSGIWHLMNDFLSSAYYISSWHQGLPDVDGSAKLRALKSEYPEYMQLLHDLYSEGIIDREFITHGGEEAQEKFAQQRVGIIGAAEGSYMTSIVERYSLNAEDYTFVQPLVKEAGEKPVYAVPPSCWMAYYVNANSSPEKQDAVLRLLDFANSEEGFILMHMGVQGVHYDSYDINTRTVVRTPEQSEARDTATSNMFAMANAYQEKQALEGGSTPENVAIWQEQTAASAAATTSIYFGATKMLDKVGVEFPDDLQTINSLEVRFVTGEAQLDELMEFINGKFKDDTSAIAGELTEFMKENPPRYVD